MTTIGLANPRYGVRLNLPDGWSVRSYLSPGIGPWFELANFRLSGPESKTQVPILPRPYGGIHWPGQIHLALYEYPAWHPGFNPFHHLTGPLAIPMSHPHLYDEGRAVWYGRAFSVSGRDFYLLASTSTFSIPRDGPGFRCTPSPRVSFPPTLRRPWSVPLTGFRRRFGSRPEERRHRATRLTAGIICSSSRPIGTSSEPTSSMTSSRTAGRGSSSPTTRMPRRKDPSTIRARASRCTDQFFLPSSKTHPRSSSRRESPGPEELSPAGPFPSRSPACPWGSTGSLAAMTWSTGAVSRRGLACRRSPAPASSQVADARSRLRPWAR